jgi:hypothetical protein
MIRQPTTWNDAHAWWRRALKDPRTPRHDADPQCGYYARRAVKGGPLIPVHVYLDQEIDPDTGELADDETIRAEELGASKDPVRIWTHLRPISRARYDELIEQHRTDQQMAAPHAAYDLTHEPMRP